jgi:hypothetical protein
VLPEGTFPLTLDEIRESLLGKAPPVPQLPDTGWSSSRIFPA